MIKVSLSMLLIVFILPFQNGIAGIIFFFFSLLFTLLFIFYSEKALKKFLISETDDSTGLISETDDSTDLISATGFLNRCSMILYVCLLVYFLP
jgi:hypothetical protein